jgi:hypothetical protein
MSHHDEHDEREGTSGERRRPYEAPAVTDSAAFETLALACGKTVGVFECEFVGETAS